MDIQTFSQTYWYVWFLVTLLIVILLLLNGIGLLHYRKRREKFLSKSSRIDENISMNDLSTVSTVSNERSKYRKMTTPSTLTNDSSETNARSFRMLIPTIPQAKTIVDKTRKISQVELTLSSNQTNDRSDMDLSLEEFQRQALKEHNSIRTKHKKSPLKLSESLNLYAQYWAEHCAQTKTITPSRLEWRLHCNGQPIGENIVSVKSVDAFDGANFTTLLMANGSQSAEVACILNEISTEIGFGRAQSEANDEIEQARWIGVAHYYPHRQLTAVQS